MCLEQIWIVTVIKNKIKYIGIQLPTNKWATIYFSKYDRTTIRLKEGKCSNFVLKKFFFLLFLTFHIWLHLSLPSLSKNFLFLTFRHKIQLLRELWDHFVTFGTELKWFTISNSSESWSCASVCVPARVRLPMWVNKKHARQHQTFTAERSWIWFGKSGCHCVWGYYLHERQLFLWL